MVIRMAIPFFIFAGELMGNSHLRHCCGNFYRGTFLAGYIRGMKWILLKVDWKLNFQKWSK